MHGYKLVIDPEVADRNVNISLRNLDTFRCLSFITQQVGCVVVAELPIGKKVVLHVLDDEQ